MRAVLTTFVYSCDICRVESLVQATHDAQTNIDVPVGWKLLRVKCEPEHCWNGYHIEHRCEKCKELP